MFLTATMVSMIWLTQSMRFVDFIINRGLSAGTFLYFIVLLLPTLLLPVLPIAAFAATGFVYHRMIMEHELVILRSAGLSQLALARPAIAMGLVVTVLCYILSLWLMPLAFRNFKELEFTFRNDLAILALREGLFNSVGDGVTIYVRQRDADGTLQGVLVQDDRDPGKSVTLLAEQGAVVDTDEGPRVVLSQGNRQERNTESGGLTFLYFDRYTIELAHPSESLDNRWREPGERFLDELFFPDPDDLNNIEQWDKLMAEGHQRLVQPLLALALPLVLLAVLVSGEFSRRGYGWRLVLGIVLGIGVQALNMTLLNLAAREPAAIVLLYLGVLGPIAASLAVLAGPRRVGRAALAGS